MTKRKRKKYIERLLKILVEHEIKIQGSLFYLNYSDPSVPSTMRINEIGIEINRN